MKSKTIEKSQNNIGALEEHPLGVQPRFARCGRRSTSSFPAPAADTYNVAAPSRRALCDGRQGNEYLQELGPRSEGFSCFWFITTVGTPQAITTQELRIEYIVFHSNPKVNK